MIEDALKDERFADNPLVVSDPHIRSYAGAPLVTSEGHVLGTLCVIDRVPRKFDIDQRRALSVLANQVMNQLELRLTYSRLQCSARLMQETNATKDKFLYIVAHDLKGPFNWMIGYSKLLEKRLVSPELKRCKEMAKDIGEGCQKTLKLLDNLLEWARCQSGKIEYRPSLIDLDGLVGEVLDLLSGVAQSQSIRLAIGGITDVEVHADRYMIFSVLQNLIHNAIKFTPSDGAVNVDISATGSEVMVAVRDTGLGMSEEALRSVLDLEEPVTTKGTDGEEGTGLGLLLCKQFLEKNGGRLEVQSQAGKGSTFRVSLPLHSSSSRPRKAGMVNS